ncbi:hypothetical protein [Dyadobacter bucti]|uniref:hypothetical protein n=1 Tax=Dyadobacter bucti TaxID=2572203 RepID=UPI003F6FE3B8
MSKILALSLAFAIFTNVSCTDHQIPEGMQWRVKTLTRVLPENPESRFVSVFSYYLDGIAPIFNYYAPDSAACQQRRVCINMIIPDGCLRWNGP